MDMFDFFLLKIVIGFILFGIIFNIIFVIHTEFDKEITIKEKFIMLLMYGGKENLIVGMIMLN